jgi:ribosome recycling factor
MPKNIIAEAERKMKAALEALQDDLATLRTGRASPALLDKIMVDYYNTPTPLKQLATVSTPDARQLVISPFDRAATTGIVAAISQSDLGLQATQDKEMVRVSVPALTEERRKEMVKLAGKKAEDHKVSIRNVRRDANDHLKKLEKDGDISKDDLQRYEGDVQKITDRHIAEVDKIREAKEAEIMEV